MLEAEDFEYVLPASSEEVRADAEVRQQLQERYAYQQLSSADQEKYRIMFRAFTTREKLSYPSYDLADASRIESYVKADHPELEDIAQFCLWEGGLLTPAYITGFYYVSAESQAGLQVQIEDAKKDCLAAVPLEADDYSKAKAIYEWISKTTDYDQQAASFSGKMDIRASESDPSVIAEDSHVPRDYGQTVANVLIDHSAVCAGYARAYQELLQDVGIPCVYVTGKVGDDAHAWCVARLDGEYYHIDPTWGDPQFADVSGEAGEALSLFDDVDYNFFCVTTEDISLTHAVETAFPLPACSSMADNYYVREGLYFGSADAERLGTVLSTKAEQDKAVLIRCADEQVFSTLLHDWLETGEFATFAPSGAYRYGSTEEPFYLLAVASLPS